MQGTCSRPFDLPVILCLVTSLGAVETGDLAGEWTLAELSGPSRLRKVYFDTETSATRTTANSNEFAAGSEELVDVFHPDPVVVDTRSFAIGAGGEVTGGESGQVVGVSGNRIVYLEGAEQTTVYRSLGGDILLASGRDEDQQEQTLCLRRPASLATAEMAGEWHVVSMVNPDALSKSTFEGKLADVYFVGTPSLVAGDITIAANGSFSGLFTGTMTASGSSPGDVTVSAGGGPIAFKTNASKNLALATVDDGDEQEYITLVRKPASLTTAELAGTWRASALRFPTTLTEILYNVVTEGGRQVDSSEPAGPNEILADLFHREMAGLTRLQLQVDDSGSFTALGGGTFTANGDRSVTLSLDGESIALQPSADKTFMVGGKSDSDSHELIVLVKTAEAVAASFNEEVDMQALEVDGGLLFNWNSASYLRLEESSGISSEWTEVQGTAGSDSHRVDPGAAGGSRFYRVAERP